MGVLDCPKHGYQGWYTVCQHINTLIKVQDQIKDAHLVIIYNKPYLFCQTCLQKLNPKHSVFVNDAYKLESFISTAKKDLESLFYSKEDLAEYNRSLVDIAYDDIGVTGFCHECFAEMRIRQARREKKEDPFFVFENTLTCNDIAEYDELKRELEKRFSLVDTFDLVDSIDCADNVKLEYERLKHPLYDMIFGTYDYPFTIRVFGAYSQQQQDAIATFILQFLENGKHNQLKIVFHEKVNARRDGASFETKVIREEHYNY